jgi:hypothetical protein
VLGELDPAADVDEHPATPLDVERGGERPNERGPGVFPCSGYTAGSASPPVRDVSATLW